VLKPKINSNKALFGVDPGGSGGRRDEGGGGCKGPVMGTLMRWPPERGWGISWSSRMLLWTAFNYCPILLHQLTKPAVVKDKEAKKDGDIFDRSTTFTPSHLSN
jgi:hypothetical protein